MFGVTLLLYFLCILATEIGHMATYGTAFFVLCEGCAVNATMSYIDPVTSIFGILSCKLMRGQLTATVNVDDLRQLLLATTYKS